MCCPSTSTRRSPACHLDALGVKLAALRPEQAAYIGVEVEGPYKSDQLPLLSTAPSSGTAAGVDDPPVAGACPR